MKAQKYTIGLPGASGQGLRRAWHSRRANPDFLTTVRVNNEKAKIPKQKFLYA